MRSSLEAPTNGEENHRKNKEDEVENSNRTERVVQPENYQKIKLQSDPWGESREKASRNNQSMIKMNSMDSSNVVAVSQLDRSPLPKTDTRNFGARSNIQSSGLRSSDRKNGEFKNFKAAITLSVLIKLQDAVRDGPFLMSMDLLKEKPKKKVEEIKKEEDKIEQEDSNLYRNPLGMEIALSPIEREEIANLQTEDKIVLFNATLEEAKKYKYSSVVRDIEQNIEVGRTKELDFNNYKIQKTIDLGIYNNLENLNLAKNKLKEIGYLGRLPKLVVLNLSGNQIKKIENLHHYKQLKELNLDGNQIVQIEEIEELLDLKVLRLSFNKIRAIQNVSHLKGLKVLTLAENLIRRIENMNDLSQLQTLDLCGNQIEKIEHLDSLFMLKWLGLGGNKIRKIENLYVLKGPAFLDIAGNPYMPYSNSIFIKSLWSRNISVKE